MELLLNYAYGLLGLSFWGYVLAGFVMVQITMMAVTLYLHRDQAHRSLDLHPALRHFFRFWIWMTSGMLTREWVAVHRKHHAFCETEGDPHSPKVFGLKKVLLEGAELYREETGNEETIRKYGRGCPDDWMERNVYTRFPYGGIILLIVFDLLLFGVPGIILIATSLVSMPLFAAGVINGVGHHSGYRNFECDDAATNIVPWGLLLGGEELHNNHHAFPTSAKFSVQPWEFDIGWMYITMFRSLGLAKVKKVAPKPVVAEPAENVDIETLRAVIVNRMHVLRDYTRHVTLPEFRRQKSDDPLWRRAKRLLVRQPALLDEAAQDRLQSLLERNPRLATVYQFRERLRELWSGATNVSNDKLVAQLRQWCNEAEASGIKALQDFARMLRGYAIAPQPA
ncbi:DesA family fatty acid desaturase [Lentisalinibacter sediminis]|uniref:DesA family fatty acid desaturase n=1 Tax=Lentisalinibacter sediminis TaxID=2992237 RepID=UPI00387080F2